MGGTNTHTQKTLSHWGLTRQKTLHYQNTWKFTKLSAFYVISHIVCVLLLQGRNYTEKLTNLTSAGETSSLESMTCGGWLLDGSFDIGLVTPLIDATCELRTHTHTHTVTHTHTITRVLYHVPQILELNRTSLFLNNCNYY